MADQERITATRSYLHPGHVNIAVTARMNAPQTEPVIETFGKCAAVCIKQGLDIFPVPLEDTRKGPGLYQHEGRRILHVYTTCESGILLSCLSRPHIVEDESKKSGVIIKERSFDIPRQKPVQGYDVIFLPGQLFKIEIPGGAAHGVTSIGGGNVIHAVEYVGEIKTIREPQDLSDESIAAYKEIVSRYALHPDAVSLLEATMA